MRPTSLKSGKNDNSIDKKYVQQNVCNLFRGFEGNIQVPWDFNPWMSEIKINSK